VSWRERLPAVRGRLAFDAPLAPFTWLRAGGAADVLFLPHDVEDLAAFLEGLDPGVPILVLGAGSNTLVRDGGVEGVVVRLGRAFGAVTAQGERVRAGAASLDLQLARTAAAAGVGGLEFYTGVPGTVGGALAMNAGCYGAETRDVLIEAEALDRQGRRRVLKTLDMGFSYRRADAAEGLIFINALFQGRCEPAEAVTARMAEITARREATQPIREKTGGSTFKNPILPDGTQGSAWRLVDAAGWRGKPFGRAMMSPQHANFLINAAGASAAELEGLGEAVRASVREQFGVELVWEVRRVGRPGDPPQDA